MESIVTRTRKALGATVAPLGPSEAIPAPSDFGEKRGFHTLRYTVRVLADTAEAVDEMLAPAGERSVKQAIESDRTLGGLVGDAKVVKATGYRTFESPDGPVFGAEWTVETLVEGR